MQAAKLRLIEAFVRKTKEEGIAAVSERSSETVK